MSKYKLDFQVGITVNSKYKSLESSKVSKIVKDTIEDAINTALDGFIFDSIDVLTNNGLEEKDIKDYYNDDPDEHEYIDNVDVVIQTI